MNHLLLLFSLSLSLAKFDWRNCLSLAADNFLSVLFLSYLYQEVNRKRPERNKRKRWNVVVYQQGYCPSRRYKSRISIILLIFLKECIDFFPRTILVISNQRTRRKLKKKKKKKVVDSIITGIGGSFIAFFVSANDTILVWWKYWQ